MLNNINIRNKAVIVEIKNERVFRVMSNPDCFMSKPFICSADHLPISPMSKEFEPKNHISSFVMRNINNLDTMFTKSIQLTI